MNTQNVNVKTAAAESTKTGGEAQKTQCVSSALAGHILCLKALRETRMTGEDRAEQLLGTLINMAERICDTVTEWSLPRPMLPLDSFRAWVEASHITHALFGETGEAAWAYASQHLVETLQAGHAMYAQDIA